MAINLSDCTFRSGKLGVSFDGTGNSSTLALVTKDSTNQVFYVHQIALCCASVAALSIWDGSSSTGTRKTAKTVAVEAGGSQNTVLDFKNDPLVFDDGSSICISCGAGAFWGFIKYEIGLGKVL